MNSSVFWYKYSSTTKKAKLLIVQYFDNVASCSLDDFPDSKTVQKCFDHECNCHWLQRRQFQAVED